jgi:hypothetical protein
MVVSFLGWALFDQMPLGSDCAGASRAWGRRRGAQAVELLDGAQSENFME